MTISVTYLVVLGTLNLPLNLKIEYGEISLVLKHRLKLTMINASKWYRG